MHFGDLFKGLENSVGASVIRDIAIHTTHELERLYPETIVTRQVDGVSIDFDTSYLSKKLLITLHTDRFASVGILYGKKCVENGYADIHMPLKVSLTTNNIYNICKDIIKNYAIQYDKNVSDADMQYLLDIVMLRFENVMISLAADKIMRTTCSNEPLGPYYQQVAESVGKVILGSDTELTPNILKTLYLDTLYNHDKDSYWFTRKDYEDLQLPKWIKRTKRSIIWWYSITGILFCWASSIVLIGGYVLEALPVFFIAGISAIFGDIVNKQYKNLSKHKKIEGLYDYVIAHICEDECNMIVDQIKEIGG